MAEEEAAEVTKSTEVTIEMPTATEAEARSMGWVNKDEFKGDPGKWRPADEWLDRGKRILPIVLKENERLQRNLDRVKDQLSEMRDSTKELLEFHKKSEERQYERARKDLEAKAEAAAANADQAGVRAAMREMDDLAKAHIPAPKPEPKKDAPQTDPVVQDWLATNQWFNRDDVLRAYAIDINTKLERDKPGMDRAEILAETKRLTMEKFPEKFGVNPARNNARAVAEPSGGGPSRKRGRTYEDLPPEAKAQCDRYVKIHGPAGFKRENFLADYDWEG